MPSPAGKFGPADGNGLESGLGTVAFNVAVGLGALDVANSSRKPARARTPMTSREINPTPIHAPVRPGFGVASGLMSACDFDGNSGFASFGFEGAGSGSESIGASIGLSTGVVLT